MWPIIYLQNICNVLLKDFEPPALVLVVSSADKSWQQRQDGQHHNTVKPIRKWFEHMHRVLLVDDDAYKVCATTNINTLLT